ncbi:MAG: tetratricopeptide repeat protein [Candidatus Zixiibacteriota bacterium]
MRKIITLSLLCALVVCGIAVTGWAGPADDFSRANQAFQDKDYQKAIDAYQAVLASGQESANLYFNLGNAYFKKGDLGFAILNFLKAKRLAPGDDDIASNLEFARKMTSVQLEGATLNPVNNLIKSIVAPYQLTAMAWISSLFFLLFMAVLIVRFGLGLEMSWLRPVTTTTLILFLLIATLTTFKYRDDYVVRRGVIVATESDVRTGPTDQSDVELHGEQGLIVQILSESGDYYNVVFENQRQGWIRKSLIAVV